MISRRSHVADSVGRRSRNGLDQRDPRWQLAHLPRTVHIILCLLWKLAVPVSVDNFEESVETSNNRTRVCILTILWRHGVVAPDPQGPISVYTVWRKLCSDSSRRAAMLALDADTMPFIRKLNCAAEIFVSCHGGPCQLNEFLAIAPCVAGQNHSMERPM